MTDHKVSVLSATYDGEREDRLDRCLRSMADQTLAPDQIVLVLDGPVRPALMAVIDAWRTHLPIEVHQREKSGTAPNLNHGLGLCRNEIVIRCDTDDINHPDRFRQQADIMASTDAAVCSGPIREFTTAGETALRAVPIGRITPFNLYSFFRNPVNGNNCALRRSAMLAVGGYPIGRMEDYRAWLRVLGAGYAIVNHEAILLEASVDNLVARRIGPAYRAAEWALWRANARRMWGLGVIPATVALAMRLPFRADFARSGLAVLYRRVLR